MSFMTGRKYPDEDIFLVNVFGAEEEQTALAPGRLRERIGSSKRYLHDTAILKSIKTKWSPSSDKSLQRIMRFSYRCRDWSLSGLDGEHRNVFRLGESFRKGRVRTEWFR
jgi:hypothetical protein